MIPRRSETQLPVPAAPFSFGLAILITVLASLVYQLSVGVIAERLMAFADGADLDLVALFFPLHGLGLVFGLGVGFALAARTIPDPPALSLGFRLPPNSAWLAALLLVPAALLISEFENVLREAIPALAPAAPPDTAVEAAPRGQMQLAASLLVLLLVQPMMSETFFRGLLQSRLAALWNGQRAVIATSLLTTAFSILTLGLIGPEPGAVSASLAIHVGGEAVLLGIARQCSGSLYPALLLAGLLGAVQWLGTRQLFGIAGFDIPGAHTPAEWLLPALICTAAGLGLYYRMVRAEEPGT